jgi:hypothetical protein
MLAELDDDNWKHVFGDAYPVAIRGDDVSTEGITRDAVAEILAFHDSGEGDLFAEWDGAGVFRLADGRYVSAWGWCDTTGWGCQDDADLFVSSTLDGLLRFGLTDEIRTQLGYPRLVEMPNE